MVECASVNGVAVVRSSYNEPSPARANNILDTVSIFSCLQKYKVVNIHHNDMIMTVNNSYLEIGWLVGCFGLNGPLRQYFSVYRAVSQTEGERRKKG